jgi:hypothetical protein
VVVRVNDFFKWGIKIGSKLCAKPHKKNKQVINIKGIGSDLVFCIAHKLYLNIIYPKHLSKKYAKRMALKEPKGLLLKRIQPASRLIQLLAFQTKKL